MEQNHDIKGILFNFSGTIDTEGSDWFDLIWRQYRKIGIPVSKSDYRDALHFAEKKISEKELIKPSFNFYLALLTKITLQIEYLVEKGLLSDNRCTRLYAQQLATHCYNMAIMYVRQNESTLNQLGKRYRLGIVSQSYGNLPSVLDDFGVSSYFTDVIESSVVNLDKPDHELFRLSVNALQLAPRETLCVSNSLNSDLLPARHIGCQTAWLRQRTIPTSKRVSNYHIASLRELNNILT